jgi:uncharacterized protein YdiU (UPF0061 family)
MTLFYRHLAGVNAGSDGEVMLKHLIPAFYEPALPTAVKAIYIEWLNTYAERIRQQSWTDAQRQEAMNCVNPLYVLRNYLAQLAIDKATTGDNSGIEELQRVLRNPYTLQEGCEHLAAKRPEWARNRAGCSMLSCSS